MMTNEQLEIEFKHLASKEDLANLKAELAGESSKALRGSVASLVGIMIALQVPVWIMLAQMWSVLTTIASRLPK